jgi:hypothetical protein
MFGVDMIVFGRPLGETAIFQQSTLQAFAAVLYDETGIEVRIL